MSKKETESDEREKKKEAPPSESQRRDAVGPKFRVSCHRYTVFAYVFFNFLCSKEFRVKDPKRERKRTIFVRNKKFVYGREILCSFIESLQVIIIKNLQGDSRAHTNKVLIENCF